MRDFPPDFRAFTERATTRDEPDTRTPRTLLWWMVRQQGALYWTGLFVALVWMVPQALGPWIVGRAIDAGIVPGDSSGTIRWVLVLAAVTVIGALSGMIYHTIIVREWLIALYGTTQLVTRKALQLGHVLIRRTPTGEVLSVSGSDGDQFGALMEVSTRAFSQLVAYLAVAAIVLSTSPRMGLLVLVSAPLLVILGTPLLRPMQHWQGIERSRNSELTSMATDIVAGLRILRGIGGEDTFGGNYAGQSQRVRDSGVRAGAWLAAVEAVGVLLSGAFVVGLMWLGTREVAEGRLTVGEFVSFLGYGLFLLHPMRTFVEFAQKWTRSVVSARKAMAVLGQRPPWVDPEHPQALPEAAPIVDHASGAVVRPGLLTMVVSAVPDDSAALADRIGRYLPSDEGALVSDEIPEAAEGPGGPARALEASGPPARSRPAATRSEPGRPGVSALGASTSDRYPSRSSAGASWSAIPHRTCSPAPCVTPSTRSADSAVRTPSSPCTPLRPRTSSMRSPAAGRASSTSGAVASPAASASDSSSCAPSPRIRRSSSSWSRPRRSTHTPRPGSPSDSVRTATDARRSS